MMNNATALKNAYQHFAEVAAPYLHLKDAAHYEEALGLIETLMSETGDSPEDPLNGLIDLLAQAIAEYENQIDDLAAFEAESREGPADVALLRLLMAQHGLGVADFPEIGDKSLVSRILSGSRNLTKQHIQRLAERFGISAGMFFEGD